MVVDLTSDLLWELSAVSVGTLFLLSVISVLGEAVNPGVSDAFRKTVPRHYLSQFVWSVDSVHALPSVCGRPVH